MNHSRWDIRIIDKLIGQIGQSCIGRRVVGIEMNRLLQVFDGSWNAVTRLLIIQIERLEVEVVCIGILSFDLFYTSPFSSEQRDLEVAGNLLGDRALNHENVLEPA